MVAAMTPRISLASAFVIRIFRPPTRAIAVSYSSIAYFGAGDTHIFPTTLYYACRKYARSAGLRRANPHAFRYSCGVCAANAGLDLIDIADLRGHKSLATAMRYAAVSNTRRDENHRRIVKTGEFAQTI